MKNIIMIFVVVLGFIIGLQMGVSAIGIGEYGAGVIVDYMEGSTIDTTNSYILSLTDANGQSSSTNPFSLNNSTAKSGNQSVKLDASVMSAGWTARFDRKLDAVSVYGDAFCFEAYVKGYSSKPDGLSVTMNFTDSYGTIDFSAAPYNVQYHFEDADANGWHRIWGTVPFMKSTTAGTIGIKYTKGSSDGFSELYIDDVSVYALPVTMTINDITYSGKSLPLDSVKINGYDVFKSKRDVVNTGLVKWSVTGGSASVDSNRNLVYTGSSSGDVSLHADFFGITANTTVHFYPGVTASTVTKTNNRFSTTVTNNAGKTVQASIIAALYNEGRLYNTYITSQTLTSGQSAQLTSPEVIVPTWVNDPGYKVFVWDGIYSMKAYKDVADNFYNFTDDFSYGPLNTVSGGGQALGQYWQTSTFDNGHGYISASVSADPDNSQNQAMSVGGGWEEMSGINMVAPHSGISSAKVIQVDIRGVWSSPTQMYGLSVMTTVGNNEIANRYQLSCTAGTCKFQKVTNYDTPSSDIITSPTTMNMNQWYTFKLVLNGNNISWSVTQKNGSYSWTGSWTDSAPFDAANVQLFTGGQWNPPAYFDNFVYRCYDPMNE